MKVADTQGVMLDSSQDRRKIRPCNFTGEPPHLAGFVAYQAPTRSLRRRAEDTPNEVAYCLDMQDAGRR